MGVNDLNLKGTMLRKRLLPVIVKTSEKGYSKSPGEPITVALVRGPIASTTGAINNEAVPAIGLAYLAGHLRKHGHTAIIVDAVAEGLNKLSTAEGIEGLQCQGMTIKDTVAAIPASSRVIGIAAMFSGEWPVVRYLVEKIRQRFPDAFIVVGGEHATGLSEFTLRNSSAIDACIRGEGEHPLLELVECISRDLNWKNVNGIAYLDNEDCYQVVSNVARIVDIDEIPWPYWPEGYLEKFWAAGKSYGVQTGRDMPFMVSRGCPFQCTFCSNPQMWTTRYILRDVEDVINEIKFYIEKYNITAIQLYDLTAITKKSWAMELCQRMIDEGIYLNWSLPSGTRSEALDFEMLSMLKKTGLNYLVYAPESGSPDTLKRIKKQIKLEKLTASVVEAKKAGLILRTNLIIGFPFETRRNIFETIRYGLYLAIRGVDEVAINIFSPYPGTELFDELQAEGRLILDDDYFIALTSLNSDYTKLNPLTVNKHMGPGELGFYRITFMLLNYGIGYLLYPSRIVRTLKNIFSDHHASTVFEHRLKDMYSRRKKTKLENVSDI